MDNPRNITALAFPDWPLHKHLEAWRYLHKGERVEAGTQFLAPDGQLFTVTGRMFWRYAGSKRPSISLVWQSACKLCGTSYTFNKPYHTRNLVRTCKAHRGKAKPMPHKRHSPVTDLVLAEINRLSRSVPRIDHETFIAQCIAAMPKPEGRDTRRQHIIRALQALIDNGKLPCATDETDLVFS